MDVNAISELITGVGFPVVMALLLLRYVTILGKEQREQAKELNDLIKQTNMMIVELRVFLKNKFIDEKS